jgi:hypothetical protein
MLATIAACHDETVRALVKLNVLRRTRTEVAFLNERARQIENEPAIHGQSLYLPGNHPVQENGVAK